MDLNCDERMSDIDHSSDTSLDLNCDERMSDIHHSSDTEVLSEPSPSTPVTPTGLGRGPVIVEIDTPVHVALVGHSPDHAGDIHQALNVPNLSQSIVDDIYNHWTVAELDRRPTPNYMESVQREINSAMRCRVVDLLVVVAEQCGLGTETLYLSVNYMDRYLSGNVVDEHGLELLGVACLMIASKYEEGRRLRVENFYIIGTYLMEKVAQMQTDVLMYLKYYLTVPIPPCFLSIFAIAAVRNREHQVLQFLSLTFLIAELSLLKYEMIRFTSKLISASSTFLAHYIMFPHERPWNVILQNGTSYEPPHLRECVLELKNLFCRPDLTASKEKYSKVEYHNVAEMGCQATIPEEFFQEL